MPLFPTLSGSRSNRLLLGYGLGALLLYCAVLLSVSMPWPEVGPLLGSLALGTWHFTAQARKNHAETISMGLCVSAICAFWIYQLVLNSIRGRENYHSAFPFIVGACIAAAICIWPISRLRTPRKRLFARGIVLTLGVAPVPFGPEGGLMPSLFGVIVLPIGIMFAGRIALTFVGALGLLSSGADLLRFFGAGASRCQQIDDVG